MSTTPDTWLGQRERGTVFLIHLTCRIATACGRGLMRPVVLLIALWYRLTDRRAVRASRQWLAVVLGRRPGFWQVFRHIHTFTQVTLDRIFLVSDKTRAFRFTRTGNHYLRRQQATGRGAVLLGAHLGSFEAMRASSAEEHLQVRILGHFQNARMINELLSRLDPVHAAKVIHLGDDPVGVMAKVHDRIEAGDFVALLGDRTGLNDRTVEADFFGRKASFPAGPFLLAALMRCPVYLVFGLYRAPNHYDLSCEPFAESLHLPRRDRQHALQALVQRYANRLEAYCRLSPYNWFNFFDFWSPPRDVPPAATAARRQGDQQGRVPSV